MEPPKAKNEALRSFTKAFHDRLPTELRFHAYDFVLDEETTNAIAHFRCEPRLLDRALDNGACTVDFNSMDPGVAREIAAHFYTLFDGYTVKDPAELDRFLKEDYFSLGLSPCDVAICKIQLKFDMDTTKPEHVPQLLDPIIKPEQSWTKAFHLRVTLHMTMIESGEGAADQMIDFLQTMRKFEKQIQKKSTGAVVQVDLTFVSWQSKIWSNINKDYNEAVEAEFRVVLIRLLSSVLDAYWGNNFISCSTAPAPCYKEN